MGSAEWEGGAKWLPGDGREELSGCQAVGGRSLLAAMRWEGGADWLLGSGREELRSC